MVAKNEVKRKCVKNHRKQRFRCSYANIVGYIHFNVIVNEFFRGRVRSAIKRVLLFLQIILINK